ncbi:hypothetical protein CP97_14722 [Aurantiacibacter atlanticus]|uniref:Uncharacterized protein n=1 Tax=Aurantiacibacter atlanticus TaxID=1648404 RepID=A0A168M1H6_9SPHN|nr:hypothetical protein CP97_14722 [Aurantiacibacter atlanticus]
MSGEIASAPCMAMVYDRLDAGRNGQFRRKWPRGWSWSVVVLSIWRYSGFPSAMAVATRQPDCAW